MAGEDVSRGGIEEDWVCILWVLCTNDAESKIRFAVIVNGFKSCADAAQFASKETQIVTEKITQKKLSILHRADTRRVSDLKQDMLSGLFQGAYVAWEHAKNFFNEKTD